MSENKKQSKIPEAEILLNKQLDMAKRTKKTDIVCIVLFCALIAAATVGFWIVPDKDYSDEEKRQLQQFPDMSIERFINDLKRDVSELFMTYEDKVAANDASPVFADEIATYYSDQFPLRNQLRTLKAASENVLLKLENNDVVFGKDGYLIKKDTVTGQTKDENGNTRDRDTKDAIETIKNNIAIINAFKLMFLEDTEVKLVASVPGRGIDVLKSKLPSFYPYDDKVEPYWNALKEASEEIGLETVDLRGLLSEKAEDEYVYYKTDHHWTGDGAYYAYVELMKSLGEVPADRSVFNIQDVSEDFYGTVYAKSGASFTGGDTVRLYRFDGDERYTTKIPLGDETQEYKGFYNMKFLNTADKYSIFIGHDTYGGNNPITYVTKDTDEPREQLILIKDSFGHSLVPLLAYHYDLVILDMRYYQPGGENKSVNELVHGENVKGMIILENMETFMNDENLQNILAG